MQSDFFDLDNRYDQLSKLRDLLVELNQIIDWNLFAARVGWVQPICQLILINKK